MYVPDLGKLSDGMWQIDTNYLMNVFKSCTDYELAIECELLGECYRTWDESGFEKMPYYIPFLDDYERCLFLVVVQRFVGQVLPVRADVAAEPEG